MFSVSADKTTVTFLFNNYGGLDGLDLNMHCSASVTFTLSSSARHEPGPHPPRQAPHRGLHEPAHDRAAQVAPPSKVALPPGPVRRATEGAGGCAGATARTLTSPGPGPSIRPDGPGPARGPDRVAYELRGASR